MSDPTGSGDEAAPAAAAGVAKDLLDMLVCPLGKAPLRLEGDRLVCTRCGLSYPIEEGIPNMLVDEARLPEGIQEIRQLACYPGAAS